MISKLRSINKAHLIFFTVFFSSVAAHGLLWSTSNIYDLKAWSKGVEQIACGQYPSVGDWLFGYPGTLFLLPASWLLKFHFNSEQATIITMTWTISLFIAWIAVLCYKLRKDTLCWGYTSIILIASPCYVRSTLPSAHIAILGCLLVIMTLYIYENREKPLLKDFLMLGIIGGLLLTSRFDFGIVYFFCAIILLSWVHIFYSFAATLTALIFTYIGTPFLWEHPFGYLYDIITKITNHVLSITRARTYTIENYTNILIIYGSLSLLIGIYLLFQKKSNQSIPKVFLAWLISFTTILLIFLLKSDHHPPWFIFPIAVSWESVLPILIYTLRDENKLKPKHSQLLLNLTATGHILAYISEIIAQRPLPPPI